MRTVGLVLVNNIISLWINSIQGFNDKILNEGPDMGFIQGLKIMIQILDELKKKQIILKQRTRALEPIPCLQLELPSIATQMKKLHQKV